MRRLARDKAHQAQKGNARGAHVIAALDRVHHAVEAALAAAGQHRNRHQPAQQTQLGINQSRLIRASFFVLSLFCLCLVRFPRPWQRRPARRGRPMSVQLAQSSMRIGTENQHDGQLLGLDLRMNMPCVSPFTSFTITSVVSPVLRSRSCTIGVHSLVSKYLRSCRLVRRRTGPPCRTRIRGRRCRRGLDQLARRGFVLVLAVHELGGKGRACFCPA